MVKSNRLPFLVLWWDFGKERRFGSFKTAETFARGLIERDEEESGGVTIHHGEEGGQLARICKDALGRTWTDLDDKAVDLLR